MLNSNLMRGEERKKLLDLCYPPEGAPRHGHRHKKHHKHHKRHDSGADEEGAGSNHSIVAGPVLNRQHNGLGNQMFQYVFSRLAAESLG